MIDRDSILETGNLLMVQERERRLVRILREHGYDHLDGVRAFEAGCLTGYNLRLLVQWGARACDMAGIDIDALAAAYCAAHSPEIRVHTGSAESIPEPDESFDIAMAFTLFSSVPDEGASAKIASELSRITKPGGLVLVYDMRRRSPRNRKVHPVDQDDIRRWFPHSPMRRYTMTLAPPIARHAGRMAPWLYSPLAAVPFLRTHALFVLRRPAGLLQLPDFQTG